ncbi:DEAD/DEAH box helicase family protein [Shewanella gelidii]|uniref:Helicase n=1 Tax=Shewanella gelidii TaxID=1642821 RepID=A0A917JMV7_9GAMM|nr:DEAD/DEAH box helicase family protein [Shewanella gelidii]MCL1099448.1 DEAD/DEAH box helicase family protein [Shewanella gelidii]GGI77073.1 helicase [Shewanella gelidii]
MKLRDYQTQAVNAAVNHFRQSQQSAVLVLPTGAGKSIVIAELARIARGRVLVLTHVKELVAQNAEKVALLTQKPGIYAAGLKQKDTDEKTTVASIQSAAKAAHKFHQTYSLVIIDECHRINPDENSQYQQLLSALKEHNPKIRILGLTATPYRLGMGWIFKHHYHGKIGNTENPVFDQCVFELPIRPLIKRGYLTPPKIYDGLSAQYDFSSLVATHCGEYPEAQINNILNHSGRATTAIIDQITQLAEQRQGVIIFAATVQHAHEIMTRLDPQKSALITATTSHHDRDNIITEFKAKRLKFIVNVAVLTTGFDAPHVDFIAILRPTASVSLFQQMVGRGLRLAENKLDCLVIDYAANGYDLYFPEVGFHKPTSKSVPVQVHCPECQFANIFWGLTDNDGDIIEHYGRRCQALIESGTTNEKIQCSFRFRSKACPQCGAENDIAARSCLSCQTVLIDPDKRLQQVLQQKHHHLFKCHDMHFESANNTLTVRYFDIEGNDFERHFKMQTPKQINACFALFIHPHNRTPGILKHTYKSSDDIVKYKEDFRAPDMILLKQSKKHWHHVESFFDYQGRHQTLNSLSD